MPVFQCEVSQRLIDSRSTIFKRALPPTLLVVLFQWNGIRSLFRTKSLWRTGTGVGSKLTSSPRLSRGLVTGLLAHGVRLALVLGHSGVDVLDDIRADRAREDGRNGVGSSRGSTIFADDRNGRSRSHCEGWGTRTCRHRKQGLILASSFFSSSSQELIKTSNIAACRGSGSVLHTSVVGRLGVWVMEMEIRN